MSIEKINDSTSQSWLRNKQKSIMIAGIMVAILGVCSLLVASLVQIGVNASSEAEAGTSNGSRVNQSNGQDAFPLIQEDLAPEDVPQVKSIIAQFPDDIKESVFECYGSNPDQVICTINTKTKLGSYFNHGDRGAVMSFGTNEADAAEMEGKIYSAARESKVKGFTDTRFFVSEDEQKSALVYCSGSPDGCKFMYSNRETDLYMDSLWLKSFDAVEDFLEDYELLD